LPFVNCKWNNFMKSFKKIVLSLATAAAFVGSAQASMINVGGVMFDPDSLLDFSGTSATLTQSINPLTGVLSGYGVITALSGENASTFCPGCELTLQYGGFHPIGAVAVPTATPGLAISYAGGWMKLFVDNTPDASATNPLLLTAANTGDGILWADLIGHAISGVTLTGNVEGTVAKPRLKDGGTLDIIGGAAFQHLNTNEQEDGADLAFTSSFSTFPTLPGHPKSLFFATGTGNFDGNSIPEPGSIALIGLGLLGAAFTRRSKAKK